jgi:hypothetical protein
MNPGEHEDSMSEVMQPGLDEAMAEVKRLALENSRLQDELLDCKDRLFDLLQPENDPSEQGIIDTFSQVTKGIDAWIDEVSGDEGFDFRIMYGQNLRKSCRAEIFNSLQLPTDIAWQAYLGKLTTSHFVILSLAIISGLMDDVLLREEIYPFGLTEEQVKVMDAVRRAMVEDQGPGRRRLSEQEVT